MNSFGNNLAQTSDDLIEFLGKEKQKKIENFRKDSLIDLHTHTCYSDGELSPNELIKLAMQKKVGTIAITDHDTILGIKNIIYGYGHDEADYVKIIPGIELSGKIDKGILHILGYNIDINNPELNKKMKELKDNSVNYVLSLLVQIKNDYGIKFSYEEIKELVNSTHTLGRVDIAKLCVKNGFSTSVKDAFNKYLIDAYNKIRTNSKGLSYEECIKLILNSGGIPVLAHPKSLELNQKELLILIKKMVENGLKGIEVYHPTHSKEEINQYLNIANRYDLLISGGSDFHGPSIKPDIEIGTGKNNNLMIKELTILNQITK